MVAVKNADVDRFIARPDPARPIILVFGPDSGLGARAHRGPHRRRGRGSARSLRARPHRRRRAGRRAGAAGGRGPYRAVVRRPPRRLGEGGRAQFHRVRRARARRAAGGRLPHRDRGRRSQAQRPAARPVRASPECGGAALLRRQRSRSQPPDRRGDARERPVDRAGRARRIGGADRRRPRHVAVGIAQARALCPRQARHRARRRARRRRRRLGIDPRRHRRRRLRRQDGGHRGQLRQGALDRRRTRRPWSARRYGRPQRSTACVSRSIRDARSATSWKPPGRPFISAARPSCRRRSRCGAQSASNA